jgi:hypothetical protein
MLWLQSIAVPKLSLAWDGGVMCSRAVCVGGHYIRQ